MPSKTNDNAPAMESLANGPMTGCRLREDLHPLIESVRRRRGFPDKSSWIRSLILRELEEEYPGSTKEAA